MVALSKQGKIFGLNSFDGSIKWTSTFFQNTAGKLHKIFIRKSVKREDEYISSQIVSVTSDSITFLNADGGLLHTQNLEKKADQFMLINLKNTKNQFVLAINHEELEKSGQVKVYPESELPG